MQGRFIEKLTSNIYFTVDMLVSGTVKQIQRVVEKAGNALDFIPGIEAVVGLAKFFIDISLGYIDECCLGYTYCLFYCLGHKVAPLPSATQVKTVFCGQCGAKNDVGTKFCGSCGAKMD